MSEQYFSERPTSAHRHGEVDLVVDGVLYTLKTDSGVFSPRRIDNGTRRLLKESLQFPSDGDILDLGCGYGPIVIALAARFPDRHIWAIDINERARVLAEENTTRAKFTNVTVCRPDEVPEQVTLAGIVSNPPIKSGKAALHEMLTLWLARLRPDGAAYVVVQKNLGADSLADWLTTLQFEVQRVSSGGGFRVLRISNS